MTLWDRALREHDNDALTPIAQFVEQAQAQRRVFLRRPGVFNGLRP